MTSTILFWILLARNSARTISAAYFHSRMETLLEVVVIVVVLCVVGKIVIFDCIGINVLLSIGWEVDKLMGRFVGISSIVGKNEAGSGDISGN